MAKSTIHSPMQQELRVLGKSANFTKNKKPENVMIETIELKNTINEELDRDLKEREEEIQMFDDPFKDAEESQSDEDTIYETMMDIQLRKEDSRTFFDNEIAGEANKKSPKNCPSKVSKKRNQPKNQFIRVQNHQNNLGIYINTRPSWYRKTRHL